MRALQGEGEERERQRENMQYEGVSQRKTAESMRHGIPSGVLGVSCAFLGIGRIQEAAPFPPSISPPSLLPACWFVCLSVLAIETSSFILLLRSSFVVFTNIHICD